MPNRIYYLRDEQRIAFNPSNGTYALTRGAPVICIVSERDAKTHKIKYGYAVLHPDDDKAGRFSKAEGRTEANKKLAERPLELESEAVTGHEINKSIIRHFSETIGKQNGKARKLSRNWLKVATAKANAAAVAKAAMEAVVAAEVVDNNQQP